MKQKGFVSDLVAVFVMSAAGAGHVGGHISDEPVWLSYLHDAGFAQDIFIWEKPAAVLMGMAAQGACLAFFLLTWDSGVKDGLYWGYLAFAICLMFFAFHAWPCRWSYSRWALASSVRSRYYALLQN